MSSASILVVDDELGLRDLLRCELEGRGHEVGVASDGLQAVEFLRRTEFDVVVTDVRMPGLDGIGVLRAVKELAPETEVIITTGFAEMEKAIECVRGGAFDFIQKPFQVGDLLATVDRAIERQRLRGTTALYQVSQVIFGNCEPQRLPERIVDIAMKVMAADDVSLILPEADDRFYLAYSHSLSPEVQATVQLALGERIAGRIAASREPVLIDDDLSKDARFKDVPSHGRVRSSIVYPLLSGDRLVGVLNINRVAGSRRFRKQDLERASVLASQVLLALENAELLRRLVESERLASVGQLAAGVGHEINNPVAYVLANHASLRQGLEVVARLDALLATGADARLLQETWNEAGGHAFLEELREELADAEDGAQRIREIVHDLRSLARGDDTRDSIIDLNEVIRSALRMTSAELRARAKVSTLLSANVDVSGSPGT